MDDAFWKNKKPDELDTAQWEALCDGCGRCCLHKLCNDETGVTFFTSLACRLLDIKTCRCRHYPQRLQRVPSCMNLRDNLQQSLRHLPTSCAYRRLAEGKNLPSWHPLISKSLASVHRAGMSVRHLAVAQKDAPMQTDLEDFIIDME